MLCKKKSTNTKLCEPTGVDCILIFLNSVVAFSLLGLSEFISFRIVETRPHINSHTHMTKTFWEKCNRIKTACMRCREMRNYPRTCHVWEPQSQKAATEWCPNRQLENCGILNTNSSCQFHLTAQNRLDEFSWELCSILTDLRCFSSIWEIFIWLTVCQKRGEEFAFEKEPDCFFSHTDFIAAVCTFLILHIGVQTEYWWYTTPTMYWLKPVKMGPYTVSLKGMYRMKIHLYPVVSIMWVTSAWILLEMCKYA